MGYEKLFEEGQIGDLTVKNRTVMVGMEVGVAEYDGSAGERYKRYFEERARGGVGLIITGVCRVNNKHGVAGPGQLALTHDRHIQPLKNTVDAVHKYDAKFIVQLHHPGRQTLTLISTYWRLIENVGRVLGEKFWKPFFKLLGHFSIETLNNPVIKFYGKHVASPVRSASNIPAKFGGSPIHDQRTKALSKRQIHKLVTEFGDAALRAKKAGADGVEVHCAHGYLLGQFLSPCTNRRTDEYGGSFENRVRIVDEIVKDIKEKCGDDFTIITRLNIDDFMETIGFAGQGITTEEGVKLAKHMEEIGFKAINVSCGTYETANYSIEPTGFELGCRTRIIRAVKQAVSIPTISVNLIRSPEQAEGYLEEGLMDFVGLGRPLLADPEFVKKAKDGAAEDIRRCICCLWCIESVTLNEVKGEPAECALNPRCCREIDYPELPKDGAGRTVVVVGGGPAGLTAARTLAERGFKTVLFEKEDRLGGQLYLATLPPHKEKLQWAIDDLALAAKKAGAEIRLNAEFNKEELAALNPCAVFVATGGQAVAPKIKGSDRENVCTVTPVLEGKVNIEGKRVAVIGSGMTGLETAEYIAARGNKVTVVEMANCIAPKTWSQHTEEIIPRLKALGVEFRTGEKVVEITDAGVRTESVKTKKLNDLPCDNTVLAIGVKPVRLKLEIPEGTEVYLIGDAAKTGRIANATHTAYKAALKLK